MSKGKFECSQCPATFETSQALGSHVRYKHRNKKNGPSSEGLDLKNAFVDLLRDVGVRRGARTIAEIYFGTGGDSIENLDQVLRLAGVSNPARALVLRRWAHRVNKQVGETLLRRENLDHKKSSDVFEAYERMRESELQGLLMDDLRTRIEERRKKTARAQSDENTILHKLNKLSEEIEELKLSQTVSMPLAPWHARSSQLPSEPTHNSANFCRNPYHSESCVVCRRCRFHGSLARIRIGEYFVCPKCGSNYFRDH